MHDEGTRFAPWRAATGAPPRSLAAAGASRRGLVDSLQECLSGEYGAIFQYLHHAFAVPPGEAPFPFFGYPRDAHRQLMCHAVHEMRHAEMLARTMARAGAAPTVAVAPQAAATTWGEMVERDIAAEQEAAEHYEDLARCAAEPDLSYLLANIAHDERGHTLAASAILAEMRRQGKVSRPYQPGAALHEAARRPGDTEGGSPEDGRRLTEAAALEYRSLWNLMYHSLLLGDDQSLAPRLRVLAVKEMRHWHGLSRRAMELGADVGATRPVDTMGYLEPDLGQGLQDALTLEGHLAVKFTQILEHLADPPGRRLAADFAAKDREQGADLEAYLGNLHRRGPWRAEAH